jgi:hypothetical protein
MPFEEVRPLFLAEYVKAHSWRRVATKRDSITVFSHPEEDRYEQIIIPRDTEVDDYRERISDAIATMATFEQRDPFEVFQDVVNRESDILRFVWEGQDTRSGSIGFLSGGGLLEGVKRALLASACSVISPDCYHPRLSRSEADQFLAASRLQHTQRGSFMIAISCPMDAVDHTPGLWEDIPFTRKVTMLLMRSLHRLVRAIEFDQLESLFQNENSQESPLSTNLCDAILRMQPERTESLRLGVSWASTHPIPADAGIVNEVCIRREYASKIENVRDRLRPTTLPKHPLFVGTVEALNGVMGTDGQRCGEVTLQVIHEGELIRVRVDLSAEQYKLADQAHMSGIFVQVEGTLVAGRRIHRINPLHHFSSLPLDTGANHAR